ncbi:hypothetical protein MBLNU230_g3391t1 [Neophaeotheca triangularis]
MATQTPSSILILGSGVFGLSTAHSLATRPEYANSQITLLDRSTIPAPDAASVDSSRIIRADYADYAYASLMTEAAKHWRGEFGAEGRYDESGLCITIEDAGGDEGGGRAYMRKSLENVRRLGLKVGGVEEGRRKDGSAQVSVLDGQEDVRSALPGWRGIGGSRGYVNWTSGWADAEAGMKHMRRKVEATGRVDFRRAEVARLIYATDRVEAVELTSGERLTADLIVLATGAWTPKFLDMRGIASTTGQVLCYTDITDTEQAQLRQNPVLLNESTGMFIIPPAHNVLKVARHGYGYANPTKIPHPENPGGEEITVSLPWTHLDDPALAIPVEGDRACRAFLQTCIASDPALQDLATRPWSHTRICYYSDTPSGDWVVSYHPRYRNLFVTAGGSGHAYKFLPVVGERIVDVMRGEARDGLGRTLEDKWRWPEARVREDHIWTGDWRGGRKYMVLKEELARGRRDGEAKM